MVVRRIACFITMLGLIYGCNERRDIKSILKNADPAHALVHPKYHADQPLASLINLEQLSDTGTTFVVNGNSKVQIYATGELDINLADIPRVYYFKNDDIELFFREKQPLVFSWQDGILEADSVQMAEKGIRYTGKYDVATRLYKACIEIPWKELAINQASIGTILPFDMAIGDNDDGMKQKAKLSWCSSKIDPLYNQSASNGVIRLAEDSFARQSGILQSVFKTNIRLDDSTLWSGLPAYSVENSLIGTIKTKDDLAANVRSCWDKQKLYLFIEVSDSRKSEIILNSKDKFSNFHDYGWIEDSTGKRVWTMLTWYSRHCGGSLKNQELDTIISLKPGKYTLRYITDESHNWNNWDDKPPLIPFYGIVIYKQKK